jgi:hypothetical protein
MDKTDRHTQMKQTDRQADRQTGMTGRQVNRTADGKTNREMIRKQLTLTKSKKAVSVRDERRTSIVNSECRVFYHCATILNVFR